MSEKQIFFAYLAGMIFLAFCGFSTFMVGLVTSHWGLAWFAAFATVLGVGAIFIFLVKVALRYQRSQDGGI